MEKKELYEMIDKYLSGKTSEEETDSLSRYYNSFQETKSWNKDELGDARAVETKIFDKIKKKIKPTTEIVKATKEKISDRKEVEHVIQKRHLFVFRRIAIAACAIGIIAFIAFKFFIGQQSNEIAGNTIDNNSFTKTIEPGSDKAILILGDGSSIALKQVRDGVIGKQGSSEITKQNNQVNYHTLPDPGNIVYNTLATPRGGKFRIKLPDGSQVWLNAASSIRFPTAFAKKERRVEITGEAYFEVAKNKTLPFIVNVSGAEVQVLGTHFNVMAYSDEPSVRTTLLEGAVKFVKGALVNTLEPGKQSQLLKTGKVKIVKGVDLDEVVAWKNGNFDFKGKDIGTVMRQLSRWYEVDVLYDEKVDDLFYAKIPRTTALPDVLKLLELTGKVHFKIDGRKIIAKR